MFGRIFASNQSGDFTCHTYPVYKQLDFPGFNGLNKSLTYVPIHNPTYHKLPWANKEATWGAALSLGPFCAGGIIGALYAYMEVRYYRKNVALAAETYAPDDPPEYRELSPMDQHFST